MSPGVPPAFMVHTHADTHADTCPMTVSAGMPLHGQPTPNHSVPAGLAHGQGPGKGGGGGLDSVLDDRLAAHMSALDIAAPPPVPSSRPAKSTASFQLAPPARKRRPAPPPPSAASPAASPAPSPTPSRPSRPAPPPPSPSPTAFRRHANGPSETVLDTNCRVPSPVPQPHGSPVYARPPAAQTAGSRLEVPPSTHLGPPPTPPTPTTPPGSRTSPKHMATLDITPAPPYGVGVVPPRSYTSVNLTLRPPSEQPQPPINIHSEGSSLTYSTSSYNPRQGVQSQLQICIGPNGLGSVSAMRTRAPVAPLAPLAAQAVPVAPPRRPPPRPPAPSLEPLAEEPAGASGAARTSGASREELERMVAAMGAADLSPDTREHLVRQLERRTLLETELHKERAKLQLMQREVAEMERDLQRRTALARPRAPPALPVMEKVQRLRTEIQTLQEECTRMAHEVDAKTPQNRIEERNNERGWTCQTCTFHNHYLLEACETCDVPRMRLGSDNSRSGSAGLHALSLSGLPRFPPPSILPSLASPALDAALAPLALTPNPTAMCVPNMLFPSPGHEE